LQVTKLSLTTRLDGVLINASENNINN